MRRTFSYRARYGRRTRPWAPGEGPTRPKGSSLFPGGEVRELWKLVDQFPKLAQPAPPQPAPLQTGLPGISQPTERKAVAAHSAAGGMANAPQPGNHMTPNHTIYDESIIPEQDASEETPDLPAAPEPTARQQRRSAKIPNNGRPANSFIPRVAGWLGLQPAIDAAQRRRKQARKAAKAVFHADLIAGRPSAGVQPLADMESARFETTGAQSPLRTERSIRQHRVTGPNASLAAFSGAIGRSRTSDAPPDFERHSRLCAVCSHPDRDAIEADFLHWRSPAQIAEDYGLPNFHPVYRHARATGLLDRRKTEVCRVMERYLEKVDSYTTDEFDQVTRAVRVYSHIGHDGRWFEGSRTNYVLTGQLPDASNVGAEIAPGTESFG